MQVLTGLRLSVLSASKTLLSQLDVVHNMGLRICSGAFKTLPIESIYLDTEHMPLDLRRKELGLHYLMRIKSVPKNLSLQVLKDDTSSQRFRGSRSSKPFQVWLSEGVADTNLKSQRIHKVEHCEIPPWLVPEFCVCETSQSLRRICLKKNSDQGFWNMML